MHHSPPHPNTARLPEFALDGDILRHLSGFFTAINRTLSLTSWGTNLYAFNDILRGGFGTPDDGFILRCRSAISAQPSAGQKRSASPKRCSPPATQPTSPAFKPTSQHPRAQNQTLFDIITSIIHTHIPASKPHNSTSSSLTTPRGRGLLHPGIAPPGAAMLRRCGR